MNSDQIKGSWKQFAGKAKETWGLRGLKHPQVARSKP
jgi:hypothetical protein